MERLADKYKNHDWIEIFVVYQKEAHSEEGIFHDIPQPTEYEVRKNHAKRLVKEFAMQNVRVLIDEMDNRTSRSYGNLPNMIFVIEPDGKLGFVSDWTKTFEVEDYLNNAVKSNPSK
jgi:hypothetical protein